MSTNSCAHVQAGATLMAVGSSAPELFTNIASVLSSTQEQGYSDVLPNASVQLAYYDTVKLPAMTLEWVQLLVQLFSTFLLSLVCEIKTTCTPKSY